MADQLQQRLQASLGDAYTIERELGGGGMSRVFVATEHSLGRRVVVKLLPPDMAASVSIGRFSREIQLAARLQHPHIVPVLAAGESDGLPYFTMPYVEGESLRLRLAHHGELPLAEAIRVLREIASALSYAHEHGIVHRDVKPDNVLLSGGAAMVTDFGVAKALSSSTTEERSTQHGGMTSMGVALGTPAYMSPEQASADPNVDHRADIYAFGVLAYEILTGQTPFGGRTPQGLLAAHVTEVPESVQRRRSGLPPALTTLVMRCLEKRPADRPQATIEIVHALDDLTTPSGGTSPTQSRLRARRARPSRWTIGLGAAAMFAVIALGGWVVGRSRQLPLVHERVVILPFANKTGDPSLAALGPMASDWITRSLSETRIADVPLAPQDIAAGARDLTSERITAVARATGAATIVGGSYYRIDDSVQFTAQLADSRTGVVVQTVGPVSALASAPVAAIEQLRRRLIGVLAARLDTTVTDIADATNQPPSYDAYREYLTADEAFRRSDFISAANHFLAAAAIDSSFTFPLVRAAYAYGNLAEREGASLDPMYATKVDSIEQVLRPRRRRMSAYDVAYLDRVVGWMHGDFNASYQAGRSLGALAPRSDFAQYVAARSALPVNRLHEAVRGLDSVLAHRGTGERDPHVMSDLTRALHRLGEHERELAVAQRGKARFPERLPPLADELYALAALGRTDELLGKVDATLARPSSFEGTPPIVVAGVAAELLWHSHPAEAKLAARRALASWSTLESDSRKSMVQGDGEPDNIYVAALITGEFDLAQRLLAGMGLDSGVARLAAYGVVAAMRGDTATAHALAVQIRAVHGPYLRGAALFGRARIAAALGDRETMIALLRSAYAAGLTYDMNLHMLPEFAPYRTYAPLLQLLASKD